MPSIFLKLTVLTALLLPIPGLTKEVDEKSPLPALSAQLEESAQRLKKLANAKASEAQMRAALAEIDSLKKSLNDELRGQTNTAAADGQGKDAKHRDYARSKVRARGALHLIGSVGCTFLANDDANTYFDRSSAGLNKNNRAGGHEPLGGIGLGLVVPTRGPLTLGVEWGFDFGPRRDFDERYGDGVEAEVRWSSITQYVMPAFHFNSFGRRGHGGGLATLGFKFGWSELKGRVDFTSPGGLQGSYTQSARTPLFALLWRGESLGLLSRLGFGYEVGYQWCKFDTIDNSIGSGITLGHAAQETNMNGSKATLDMSGWTFKLTLSGWSAGRQHRAKRWHKEEQAPAADQDPGSKK